MKIMNLTFKLNLKKCVRCVFCRQGIVYLYMTDDRYISLLVEYQVHQQDVGDIVDNIKCMLYYCYWSMLSIF